MSVRVLRLLRIIIGVLFFPIINGMSESAAGSWRPGAGSLVQTYNPRAPESGSSVLNIRKSSSRSAQKGPTRVHQRDYATRPLNGASARRATPVSRNGLRRRKTLSHPSARVVRPGYYSATGYQFSQPCAVVRRKVCAPRPCPGSWGFDLWGMFCCFFRRVCLIKPTYCQPYRCCQPKPECCPAERPPCPPLPCVDECGRPPEGPAGMVPATGEWELDEMAAYEAYSRDGLASSYI